MARPLAAVFALALLLAGTGALGKGGHGSGGHGGHSGGRAGVHGGGQSMHAHAGGTLHRGGGASLLATREAADPGQLEFRRLNPCPSTGATAGPCPGFAVRPAARGGAPEAPPGWQWHSDFETRQ